MVVVVVVSGVSVGICVLYVVRIPVLDIISFGGEGAESKEDGEGRADRGGGSVKSTITTTSTIYQLPLFHQHLLSLLSI